MSTMHIESFFDPATSTCISIDDVRVEVIGAPQQTPPPGAPPSSPQSQTDQTFESMAA